MSGFINGVAHFVGWYIIALIVYFIDFGKYAAAAIGAITVIATIVGAATGGNALLVGAIALGISTGVAVVGWLGWCVIAIFRDYLDDRLHWRF